MIRLLLLGLVLATPALAQGTAPAMPQNEEEMMKTMHLAAHNQLGVLEYCQDKGSVDASTVALQRRMIGILPPVKVDGLDAAEAAGKQGRVQFAGQEVKIEDAATRQGTTPDAMCKQMQEMLKAQEPQLPK